VLAVVFNLILPGLGHAYMGKLGRALIWAAGAIALGLVLQGGATEPPTWARLVLPAALAACAAVDIAALMRMDGTARDRP
jgi:hypothetical protein